jgi:hypothetical protein
MGRSRWHERERKARERRNREWGPGNLRLTLKRLQSLPPGPLPLRMRRLVARGLYRGWYALQGPGSRRSWVLGQADEIHWDPPLLTFQVWFRCGPWHGRWHDLQRWTVDLERRRRSIALVERRPYHWRDVYKEFRTGLIAEELARMVRTKRRDPRLHWSKKGRVRLQIREVLPRLARRIVQGRRGGIEDAMSGRLSRAGIRRGNNGWWGHWRLEPVKKAGDATPSRSTGASTPTAPRWDLRSKTNDELLQAYIAQSRNGGWTSSKASYVAGLSREMERRRMDVKGLVAEWKLKEVRSRRRRVRGGIVGWREWILERDPATGEFLLGSAVFHTPWEGPVIHAEAPEDDGDFWGCRLGIHSWRPEHARPSPRRFPVHGHVINYGTVVAHRRGYRARHVVVRDLTVRFCIDAHHPDRVTDPPDHLDLVALSFLPYDVAAFPAVDRDQARRVADSLARRYDCPVEIEPLTYAELEELWT